MSDSLYWNGTAFTDASENWRTATGTGTWSLAFAGTNFPADGIYGGYYAQGVIKGSPHQNCAKLWVEHILSDEGALGYVEGGAIPARYAELVKTYASHECTSLAGPVR